MTATAEATAQVDPNQTRYAYGGGELLAWPVALGQASGKPYNFNWDWGVRARDIDEAISKEQFMADDFPEMTCPADVVRLASPWYPREGGLIGDGDPDDPTPPSSGLQYWGRMSYAINEDVTGTNLSGTPACWRAVNTNGMVHECLGEHSYHPASSCGDRDYGNRLEGRLDQVFDPATAGLLFDRGMAKNVAVPIWQLNLVYSATPTPTLQQYAGPNLENFQLANYEPMAAGNLHPGGRLNVLYADFHADSVRPTAYMPSWDTKLPTRYEPRVRVSPYNPHGIGEN